jgi:hypothetical protein
MAVLHMSIIVLVLSLGFTAGLMGLIGAKRTALIGIVLALASLVLCELAE